MADDKPSAVSAMLASDANKGDTANNSMTQEITDGNKSGMDIKLSQTTRSNRTVGGPPMIMKLPDELLLLTTSHLANKNLKNLRLTCKAFALRIVLSIPRVCVKMRKSDLKIMRGVAKRPELAVQVKEVVWVNVHFIDRAVIDHYGDECNNPDGIDEDEDMPLFIPHGESYEFCSHDDDDSDDDHDDDKNSCPASDEKDDEYERLRSEKKDIIDSEEHIKALRDALPYLTSLRRVTIEETFYLEKRWTVRNSTRSRALRAMDLSWPTEPWSRASNNFHHYGSVMRELETSTCAIKELILKQNRDVFKGIPYKCFEHKAISKHMKSIGTRGLERLHLTIDLTSIGDFQSGLISLSGEKLHDILSEATSMKRFRFRTNWLPEINDFMRPPEAYRHALKAIPTNVYWPALKHLTLSNMPIASDDLLALFGNLSSTIVDLKCHYLVLYDGIWDDLLPKLKDQLPRTQNKLTVTITLSEDQAPSHGRGRDRNRDLWCLTITMKHIGDRTDPEVYCYQYYAGSD